MARDIKFWKEDGSFKLRVCGIIKKDEKYLIVDNCDNCYFSSFPGGHVQLGESTNEAVVREIFEEINIETRIVELIAIVQLFFSREDGKPFHEIGFYYLLEPISGEIDTKDFVIEEIDNGVKKVHKIKWVTLDEFNKYDVRPTDMKEILKKNLYNQYIIHKEYD